MICQTLIILALVVSSLANNEHHEYRSKDVENAIKRYSRQTNVNIGPIKMKQFVRTLANKDSLATAAASESKKLKYDFF